MPFVFIIVPDSHGYNHEGKGILEPLTVGTGGRDINRKEIQLGDIEYLPLSCIHLSLPGLLNFPKHSPKKDWKVNHSWLKNTQTFVPNWGNSNNDNNNNNTPNKFTNNYYSSIVV